MTTVTELPEYVSVHNEVARADCYRLKQLDFVPDVILDVGANLGIFANHARSIFPLAKIICVEPDGRNFAYLTNHAPQDAQLIQAAIGAGEVWRVKDIDWGCHYRYITPGVAYPETVFPHAQLEKREDIQVTTIRNLICQYLNVGQRSILKIDIEGNEDTIFTHTPSMAAMLLVDYVCIEVHRFAADAEAAEQLDMETRKALELFSPTHHTHWQECVFFARKME